MRAVVAGAGIGGLAAAVALHQRGWQVTVLERATALEPVGAGISLWPNALRALDVLGLAAPLRQGAVVSGRSGVRRPDGRWVARSDVGGAVRARFGEPLVIAHRADLVGLLVGALPDDAVRLGVTATGLDPGEAGRALLRTTAGDLPADLLVAADGIRSALRPALFPGHPGPSYAGYVAWRMGLPALSDQLGPLEPLEPFETWGTGGRRFAVLPLSGDRWYCYATAALPRGAAAGETPREGLLTRFAGWHEPIPSILAAVPEQAVLRQDVEELAVPLPAMHRGRTAVLGDAAHAMTPDLGQGGCMALEDAVELAACVSDSASDVSAGLAEYSRRRLPRTSATALRSRRAGRLYTAPYPLQLAAARVMGLLPDALVARGLDGLLRWQPPG
ncbi:MAG: FAD-dependent monooxygenase [Motilibacteraceae bacterium]